VNSFTSPVHTYSSGGIYTITIVGSISGIRFNNTGDRLKMLNVISWGALTNLGSTSNTGQASDFYGCSNLTSTATDSPILVRALALLFRGCSSLNGGISNWNTSQVTSFNQMFRNATVFNQDIGNWDVGNVTTFDNMFLTAPQFNNGGSDSIKNWNTSKVTNMSQTFTNATAFNQPIGSWDTSTVTGMSGTFNGARDFNQNIGSWNISGVTNFTNFMVSKNSTTFSSANLDAIYNGWSAQSVKPNLSISFGTAKYTSASSAGRAILTSAPNNWTITDGGL
jgi:surface protein